MWRISSLMPPPYNQKHFSLIVTMGTWSHSWRWISNIVVVQSLHCVQLFPTPWTAAHQASLSFTITQSLLKLISIELVMPSNYLILCHPILHLPSVFPSIRVFSNESALHIRWPKYWSFSFSLSPFNEYSGLISFRIEVKWSEVKSFSRVQLFATPWTVAYQAPLSMGFSRQ